MGRPRYRSLGAVLYERYGRRTWKVSLDAGFACPNGGGLPGGGGCAYCRSDALRPARGADGLSVAAQLEAGIEYVRRRHRAGAFVAYFQSGTSTNGPTDRLAAMLDTAVRHPEVVALAVSTRPDCLGPEVLDLLCRVRGKKDLWIELGLQSIHERTLRLINRGHTAGDFICAARAAMERGIDVCAHLIMGLPGEERRHMAATVGRVAELGLWGVKFHQLQVLRGTPLETMYRRGEVTPLGLDEYASIVADAIELLPPETVIHRLCGDAPRRLLVAPRWGAGKFAVAEAVEAKLRARGTRQGAARRL
ncbi:MAG TPA: TIGR01212 family radical SAM protein [Deltaproteobacteria bacterium]|nr:TIGR01212 family radical SAM protein [Deltaproteobacteria bacterium]